MLKLSTNTRYGTRILVYLALQSPDTLARRQDIADKEKISSHYVEQILLKLRSAGLAKSLRGAKGGFMLAKAPEAITVNDVIEATEGPMDLAPCINSPCDNLTNCVTHAVWEKASNALKKIFNETTIADIARKSKENLPPSALMFNI